jgi:hypothetical protein
MEVGTDEILTANEGSSQTINGLHDHRKRKKSLDMADAQGAHLTIFSFHL